MKKFSLILRYASSSLVALVALIFTVLEATLLATLDFTLSENQFTAFIQLILRLMIAASALALGLLSMIKTKKSFLPHSLCLLVELHSIFCILHLVVAFAPGEQHH